MIYGYIRVSTDRQTVENQRFEINRFCETQQIVVNSRFHVELKMPYNTQFPFIDKRNLNKIFKNKFSAVLCCIQYINKIISPQSNFKNQLFQIIEHGGNLLRIKDMGFPENWKTFGVWK
jgi:abortive infection bacteriophage resistance protein